MRTKASWFLGRGMAWGRKELRTTMGKCNGISPMKVHIYGREKMMLLEKCQVDPCPSPSTNSKGPQPCQNHKRRIRSHKLIVSQSKQ